MRCLALAAAAVLAPAVPSQANPSVELDTAFASARPDDAAARWTLVPWRSSLTESLAEAGRRGKPVYLYVNDGEVDSGRC